jgi:hypothetical protein
MSHRDGLDLSDNVQIGNLRHPVTLVLPPPIG